MNDERLFFVLGDKWTLKENNLANPTIIDPFLQQLKDVFQYFSSFTTYIRERKFIYSKMQTTESTWICSEISGEIKLIEYTLELNRDLDYFNLKDELQNIKIMDFSRLNMRKYSHDISNLLTVMLINLGYLNDEVEEGGITTNDDETVKQVLGSSLKTAGKLKELIETTKKENEWEITMIEGNSSYKSTFDLALSLLQYKFQDNFLILASYPEQDIIIPINNIRAIQCIQILLLNFIYAENNNSIKFAIFQLKNNEDAIEIQIHDNGEKWIYNQKYRTIERNMKRDQILEQSITNLEKIISLKKGEVNLKEEKNILYFTIPK